MRLPYLTPDDIRELSDAGLNAVILLCDELETLLDKRGEHGLSFKVGMFRDDLEVERFAREQKAA